MKKHLLFAFFFTFFIGAKIADACHGAGITLQSVVAGAAPGTYDVTYTVCIGFDSNFDETNSFSVEIPGVTINSVTPLTPTAYTYVAFSGFCGPSGSNAFGPFYRWPEYNVNANVAVSSSGSTVNYTNTSVWGTYTGWYFRDNDVDADGVPDGTPGSFYNAASPCAAPAGSAPYVPFSPYVTDVCASCVNIFGEAAGTNTSLAVNSRCITIRANVSAYPSVVRIADGVEGAGAIGCNSVYVGGAGCTPAIISCYNNFDTQEACTSAAGTPCDLNGTTQGTAVVNVDIALPIELRSFTGELVGKTNLLKWETAGEQNVDYFQIERIHQQWCVHGMASKIQLGEQTAGAPSPSAIRDPRQECHQPDQNQRLGAALVDRWLEESP